MKKLLKFIFLIGLLLSCNTGTENKPNEEPEKQKPVLRRLEILKVSDGSSIKALDTFESNVISGIETEEEKVRISFFVDIEVRVYFTPDSPNYEFTLSKVGDNVFYIKLEKDGLENVYILTIKRKSTNAEMREIKELRFTTDYIADYDRAIVANKNASDDKLFEIQTPHTDSEKKYFIFVEGKEETDVVFIDGKIPPYPKANKQRIEVGNLAKVGGETNLSFYLFKDGVDTANLGLGTKYTLKVSIKKEPNIKIKWVKFNEKVGEVSGNQITCEHEFDVATVINTTMELDDTTSTSIVNEGKPVKIEGNGAKFDIVVIPEEGQTFKATYNVALKAKSTLVKKITSIKYFDGGPVGLDDLTMESIRKDDVCLVEYSDGNFTFLPIPSNEIKIVEQWIEWKNAYSEIQKNGPVFSIRKNEARNLTKGIKIKVTFKDDTTDEFTIKKK